MSALALREIEVEADIIDNKGSWRSTEPAIGSAAMRDPLLDLSDTAFLGKDAQDDLACLLEMYLEGLRSRHLRNNNAAVHDAKEDQLERTDDDYIRKSIARISRVDGSPPEAVASLRVSRRKFQPHSRTGAVPSIAEANMARPWEEDGTFDGLGLT